MSIAQSLIQILQEEMAKHGAATLRSVRLSIGEMSAIVPESLSFCFEIITQGTPLEGAKLLMDRIPLKGYCPDCDQPFEIKDFVLFARPAEAPILKRSRARSYPSSRWRWSERPESVNTQ